jgi:hypothetical protein
MSDQGMCGRLRIEKRRDWELWRASELHGNLRLIEIPDFFLTMLWMTMYIYFSRLGLWLENDGVR